jgi:hypothetical protein
MRCSRTYQPAIDVWDDWKPMGDAGHLGRLTYGPAAACPPAATPTGAWTVPCPAPYPWGDDRSGGLISAIEPSSSDPNVVWAATSFGRIFVTTNAGAADPSTIVWHRIDTSSLKIDQANRLMYVTTHGFGALTLKLP